MGAAAGLAFGLALAGRPAWASALGAATITAAIGVTRWSSADSEPPLSAVRARIVVNAGLAGVGGAAVFGVLRFVLGPAYPAVREWSGSPWAAAVVTVAFGLLAYLDTRPGA